MNPPTIKELRERLQLSQSDAKCLRRLMGITMRRDSKPEDKEALDAPGPYVNRCIVPAVLRFACWALGSGGTRTVLVPDGESGSPKTYDRVAQYVARDGVELPTVLYDHMRSRWLVATYDEFWASAGEWMGSKETARVVVDLKGPADEHNRLRYGRDLPPSRDYVTSPQAVAPGSVVHSDTGFHRFINAVAEDALYGNH